jgi:hypothetical protein
MTEIATAPTVHDLRRRWKPHKERFLARRFEQPTANRLDAILITQDGKPNGAIVGIITTFDIPKLHSALGLSSDTDSAGKPG